MIPNHMEKVNPESIVNASIAAMAAAQAAWQTFLISMVLILLAVLIIVLAGMILTKISQVEKQTNSMKDQLVLATRKLGLMEGEAIGRAAGHEKKEE